MFFSCFVSELYFCFSFRDDRKCLGTDREKTVLAPQNKFYNDLGITVMY